MIRRPKPLSLRRNQITLAKRPKMENRTTGNPSQAKQGVAYSQTSSNYHQKHTRKSNPDQRSWFGMRNKDQPLKQLPIQHAKRDTNETESSSNMQDADWSKIIRTFATKTDLEIKIKIWFCRLLKFWNTKRQNENRKGKSDRRCGCESPQSSAGKTKIRSERLVGREKEERNCKNKGDFRNSVVLYSSGYFVFKDGNWR